MSTMSNLKELALNLPVSDRASLASILLRSLPEVLNDHDGGVAEARRRRDELNANPEIGISPEELRKRISETFEI